MARRLNRIRLRRSDCKSLGSRGLRGFGAAALALAYCLSACSTWVCAQPLTASEDQIKAAYIYNFGKFVKWPVTAASAGGKTFSICVLGQDAFGDVLKSTLAGESINGRPVAVMRLAKPQDAASCRILFVGPASQGHLPDILAIAQQHSVLTVSDMPDFSKQGGMIQLVLKGDRVRFEINLGSAQNANLQMASDLLKVAVLVRQPGRSEE